MSHDFTQEHLQTCAAMFAAGAPIQTITRNSIGHINDTFVVELSGGAPRRFILQRINTSVFPKPVELMRNMQLVTDFLREKITAIGSTGAMGVLCLLRTPEGSLLYIDAHGGMWRASEYVEDTESVVRVTKPDQLYQAGRAFGQFQRLLSDFPAEQLFPVIADFHNTAKRFTAFEDALAKDAKGRAADVQAEIDFVLTRRTDACVLQEMLDAGRLPLRVTHNDTKINNVLLDTASGEARCVIDLDTVMPGSLLFDFGDAIRSGVNTGNEDEPDLSKVHMDLSYYRAFTQGFLEQTAETMTPLEKELLPFGAKMMTFECGMRFLTDYLNGDTYFHTSHPRHNLDRTRTQFRLVAEMEEQEAALRAIQQELLGE